MKNELLIMKRKKVENDEGSSKLKRILKRVSFPLSPFLLSSFFLFTLGLSGCMVGPDYEKPEVDTPAAWRFQVTDAADTVNTAWWNQFNDPVLDQLVEDALDNNKDVRIAAARVEEFAARVNIARSGLFPQFGYNGSADRSKASLDTVSGVPAGISRTNDLYNASLNVGWELDLWGKIRRATEAARAELLASEEARRTVILSLVTTVASSYIGLRTLDRQLEIAKRTLKIRKDSLYLFELQFKGGVVSKLEVSQVRSEYEQAAVRVPALERQIAVLENAISVLLGKNPGSISRGKSLDELVLIRIPGNIPSELLERRPDIRLAEQNLIAANAQIGVAKAQYFPSISLTGLFGYASVALSDLFNSTANLWGLNGLVLGPVFSGGRLTGQLRVSEAVQRQVLITYLQTVQNAFREVDDALITTQKRREELDALGRQVAALKDYARLARLNYDEGQVSFIEVLDAERRLFDVELIETQGRNDVYVSLVTMYKVIGGGWVVEAEGRVNK
ncbi:outer membrane protein OprM precursor [bacterium BMS3Abin11]|nr:outer membrane protein OprM precursor [bacterium BMS3Abin11]GMT41188.1 MAG: RND transporter [bacterium]